MGAVNDHHSSDTTRCTHSSRTLHADYGLVLALLRLLRLCQWYQAQQKARHDEDNHYLEKPGVRLFARLLHNALFAPVGTTTAEPPARDCWPKLRTTYSLIAGSSIEPHFSRKPSRDVNPPRRHSIPERRRQCAIARLLHLGLVKSPRIGTQVAGFLTSHSPTPSDFGWPGYAPLPPGS